MSAEAWERIAVAAGIFMGVLAVGLALFTLAGRAIYRGTRTFDTADDPESVSEAISEALAFADSLSAKEAHDA